MLDQYQFRILFGAPRPLRLNHKIRLFRVLGQLPIPPQHRLCHLLSERNADENARWVWCQRFIAFEAMFEPAQGLVAAAPQ
jgi:hypothetical protein